MEIEFRDSDDAIQGEAVITSSIFEFKKHVRLVDRVLFRVPQVRAKRTGFFTMKTIITGHHADAYLAYIVALEGAAK